ncbi:MAG: site-specific DNA-methyltransferase [Muribaculaceae bacterium]|nr:site-specific DNA-methyltransferase [Muribaculaceae bacterium]
MNKRFLPDSYTSFKNKIGLTNEDEDFVAESREVVLSWPYKDCVLEGGQTKEDAKRNEVFWNEILAPDEINRLTEPKVLTNFVRYDRESVHAPTSVSSQDNYIIKGNNLLVLHSLLKKYESKIKLIYIDPPYNTGNDSFGYNDKFNRSAWLTFMRNRLVLAKKLLAPTGAIYVQLDYHQAHYAKVLLDEVFGEENFQREIIWRIGWLSGYKTADKNWIRNHDTIFFYSKDASQMEFNKYYIPRLEYKQIAEGNSDRYPIEDVWNGNEYDDLNSIAIVSFAGETVSKMLNPEDEVKGQKSEKLLERIIRAHTNEGDLVLDFFGGTGTTGAVSMKMGRCFILVEQLDKHLDIMRRRMNKVIEGEQSGISKRNNWQGGGSFVYCELAIANQRFIDEIVKAENTDELKRIWDDIQESGFLSWKVEPKTFNENVKEFEELSLDEQKFFLIECLDKNFLYIPLSEINNKEFEVSNEDKKLNAEFYDKSN